MNENQFDPKILISDDHALIRGGLESVINIDLPNSVVLHANSLEETIKSLSNDDSIDLVLLDLMMPGMDGYASIKSLCSQFPDAPIIIISVKDDVESIQQSIAMGALGYIPKTSDPEVTVRAINLVLAGGMYIPPNILENTTSQKPSRKQLNRNSSYLTKRQLEVLELIKLGMSNQSIANNLNLTMPTVKMHVSAILKKLDVSNRTEAVAKHSKTL